MADAKVTALTEATTFAATDLLYIITDVVTTPTSKKITPVNLVKGIGLLLTEYADNAAALAGGLVAGQLYRNGDFVCVVH